jgi:hypothetical protein
VVNNGNSPAGIPTPTPTTVAAPKQRRRDRDLAAANTVISKMRRGPCVLRYVGAGNWRLSDDAPIKPHIAEIVIADSGVAADGDTLFADLTHSQTYRAVLR